MLLAEPEHSPSLLVEHIAHCCASVQIWSPASAKKKDDNRYVDRDNRWTALLSENSELLLKIVVCNLNNNLAINNLFHKLFVLLKFMSTNFAYSRIRIVT